MGADLEKRNREIQQSDEHWSVLADRYDLSRSSIYRIRAAAPEEAGEPDQPPVAYDNQSLLFSSRFRNMRRGKDLELYAAGKTRLARESFEQMARSGLDYQGGEVVEEYQRELQAEKGWKIYREMSHHPVVAATLLAIRMTLRGVKWWCEPPEEAKGDEQVAAAAEFVDQCREDMSQSWSDVISQVYAMLEYGFQLAEIVYKKRLGQEPAKYVEDPARSRYDDGRIGWRRFQFISPHSLAPGNAWILDENGRVQGANQTPPPDYEPRSIPMEKLLLFRTDVRWDNPEGVSLLRAMYKSWYFAENLAEVEAIGAERLGVGLPVIYLGSDCSFKGSNSDYELAKDIVVNVRADEQMGLVIPKAKMGSGADEGKGMLFELASPPSRGLVNFSEVIGRYEQRMAMAVLAQFIFLGMTKVGTQALAGETIDFFTKALGAWNDMVADVFNRFAIPRLLSINGVDTRFTPVLRHSEAGAPDLQEVAEYINVLVGMQIIKPYPELGKHLLEIGSLPAPEGGMDSVIGEGRSLPGPGVGGPPPLGGGMASLPRREGGGIDTPDSQRQAVEEAEEGAHAEGREAFALRTRQGGPKWERATNEYQRRLQNTWDAWADETARALAEAENNVEREEILDGAIAAIVTALVYIGRERLPSAVQIGLDNRPMTPELISEMGSAVAENERYLTESLGPDIRSRILQEMARNPLAVDEVATYLGALVTLRPRVGQYAGAFWSLVMLGFIWRLRQDPDLQNAPVRWVLDAHAKHCVDCAAFGSESGKEYENAEAMLGETGGKRPSHDVACNGNCRCWLEVYTPQRGWSRWSP